MKDEGVKTERSLSANARSAAFRSSLVSDPGPPRCIASGVRRLESAQVPSSNSRLTLPPSSLFLIVLCAALCGLTPNALAQDWPERPVRILVPFAPGGVTDGLARISGDWLSRRLGQTVIVENRPGASGTIAATTTSSTSATATSSVAAESMSTPAPRRARDEALMTRPAGTTAGP